MYKLLFLDFFIVTFRQGVRDDFRDDFHDDFHDDFRDDFFPIELGPRCPTLYRVAHLVADNLLSTANWEFVLVLEVFIVREL